MHLGKPTVLHMVFFKQSINQQKQLGYIFFFMSKQVTQPKISLILKQNENLPQKAIYWYALFARQPSVAVVVRTCKLELTTCKN